MPRKAKEYSKWPVATWDARPHRGTGYWPYIHIANWLREQGGEDCFHQFQSSDYDYPRKQWASKHITHHHFCIKDPKMLNYVVLKWGLEVEPSLEEQYAENY